MIGGRVQARAPLGPRRSRRRACFSWVLSALSRSVPRTWPCTCWCWPRWRWDRSASIWLHGRSALERGRLAATVVYAALPVAYNALSQGHWAGVIGYAAAPWLLGALCRLGGQAPYPRLRWGGAWARFIALGLLVAVATSLAPATLLLVPVVGCALFVGSLLTGRGRGGARFLFASLMASGVAFLALAPWSFAAFRTFDAFFELAGVPVGPLSVSSVLRLDTGSYGGGALGWAVLAAAAVPLFIGRSWRMAWAARLWVVAFTCLGLVWAGRGAGSRCRRSSSYWRPPGRL